jgi:hypothetical protein
MSNYINQSRLGSFIESMVNVVLGLVVALGSQLIIFPIVGIHVPLSINFKIMAWFTLISVVRSYIIRRWFNSKIHFMAFKFSNSITRGA